MYIYLDIETIPGQSPGLKKEIAADIKPPANYSKADTIAKWEIETKPDLIEKAWRDTSFVGDRGEIICIGSAIDSTVPQTQIRKLGESESDLIVSFFDALSDSVEALRGRSPCWVGHNVRDFDLRFIYQRCVILGIRPPFRLPHDARPGSDALFDTMTAWAGWGGRISLARLCKALGLPSKGSEIGDEHMDGSKVWPFVQAGRYDDIARYCAGDVERVQAIHQRMLFQTFNARLLPKP